MRLDMNRPLRSAILAALLFAAGAGDAPALSWTWVEDPTDDHFGSGWFSIQGMGFAFDQTRLHFAIRTNLPETGWWGTDSYAHALLNPGDLRINANGNIYGLAFSTHANVVEQAYSGVWPTVTKGNLYSSPVFADGTLEQYEEWISWRGITPMPSDGDLYDGQNSYPTLIRGFSGEREGVGSVQWNETPSGTPWLYEIVGSVDTLALGLDYGESFELFWSMECGNDATAISGVNPIPEPATMLLLGGGLFVLTCRLRRRTAA